MTHGEKPNTHGGPILDRLHSRSNITALLLFVTSLLIALVLFPSHSVTLPKYQVGDIVQKDIKSPKDFLIEDKAATREKQDQASQSVLTIYDLDDTLAAELGNRVTQAFVYMRELAETYQENAENGGQGKQPTKSEGLSTGGDVNPEEPISLHDLLWAEKQNFENVVGIQIADSDFEILEKEGFSDAISSRVDQLLETVLETGIVADKQLLLQELEKGIVVRRLSSLDEAFVKNLQNFYSRDEAQTAMTKVGRQELTDVNYGLRNLIVDVAQGMTQPNLTLNKGETEARKKKAVAEVKPVLTQVKQGEMLLREGEKVTESELHKLEALQTETDQEQLFTSIVGFILLVMIFFVITFSVNLEAYGTATVNIRDLMFLSMMLVALFFLIKVSTPLTTGIAGSIPYPVEAPSLLYAIPVATGSMTVCLFMGVRIALPFSVAMAFLAAFLFENRFEMFTFFLLSSIIGSYWVRTCKERGTLIKAGLKVGFANMLVVSALHLLKGWGMDVKLAGDWIFSFAGGVTSGILVTGLAPVIEMMFGYTTDIKMLELSNLDRPILRKLMLEAPGTYHHSVVVGSLVEAAASAIGANPLLAKASGYYHDIGKIKKPLYFIENQARGDNKHDKLAPSMSSLILIAHVKDGVDIAKNGRLGREIVDIIQQHHGTSLITYFYEKAKQQKGEHSVKMEHFRYPGPKPQTKEAGLVLLADAVEASSRALENPTPARIQGLVQKIINKIFLDGQLDDCELTLKDLHEIARSFNKILTGIHHHRIEYPEAEARVNSGPRRANGDPDRRQTRSPEDRAQEDREEGADNLKRLGMS
jgi:putative nucleotidyltransferase with HDIG domain